MTLKLSLLAAPLILLGTLQGCEIGDVDNSDFGDGDGDEGMGGSQMGGAMNAGGSPMNAGGMGGDSGDGDECLDTLLTPSESIEIEGVYENRVKEPFTITELELTTSYSEHYIVDVFNQEGTDEPGFATVYNSTENDLAPVCKWGVFFWHVDGENTYLCHGVIGEDTEEEALLEALDVTVDPSDLATGCDGNAWEQLLTPQ